MFSSKKEPERPRNGGNLSQGLFDINTDVGNEVAGEGGLDHEDLEADVTALTTNGNVKRPASKHVVSAANLDLMVQESMKDVPSDEDLSVDEDDPDLLRELTEITGGAPDPTPEPSRVKDSPPTDIETLLQERLKMYELAETNAKTGGETSRTRRFNRGLKTIKDLLKLANAGRPINNEDIPPEVTVNIQHGDPLEIPQEPSRPPPPLSAREASPEQQEI